MSRDDKISETAFLVSVSRRNFQKVSEDSFAAHWVTSEAESLHRDYCAIVSPPTDMVVCIRGRYFLKQIKTFCQSHPNSAIVNFGAGFSNYPFLIDEKALFVEVDFPHIINYKRRQIEKWQREGTFPKRSLDFLSGDLCSSSFADELSSKLGPILNGRPSLILMEAVVYYLTPIALRNLFACCREVQFKGCEVVLNYWPQGQSETEVFKLQQSFFLERLGRVSKDYLLLEREYFDKIDGYKVMSWTDIQELEGSINGSEVIKNSDRALGSEFVKMCRL